MGGFLKNESLRRLEQDQRTGRPAGQQSGRLPVPIGSIVKLMKVTSVDSESAIPYRYLCEVRNCRFDDAYQETEAITEGALLFSDSLLTVGDHVHAIPAGDHWEIVMVPSPAALPAETYTGPWNHSITSSGQPSPAAGLIKFLDLLTQNTATGNIMTMLGMPVRYPSGPDHDYSAKLNFAYTVTNGPAVDVEHDFLLTLSAVFERSDAGSDIHILGYGTGKFVAKRVKLSASYSTYSAFTTKNKFAVIYSQAYEGNFIGTVDLDWNGSDESPAEGEFVVPLLAINFHHNGSFIEGTIKRLLYGIAKV